VLNSWLYSSWWDEWSEANHFNIYCVNIKSVQFTKITTHYELHIVVASFPPFFFTLCTCYQVNIDNNQKSSCKLFKKRSKTIYYFIVYIYDMKVHRYEKCTFCKPALKQYVKSAIQINLKWIECKIQAIWNYPYQDKLFAISFKNQI